MNNSTRAYHQIKAEGLLSPMRWEVYHALHLRGPATASELAATFPPSAGGRGAAGNIHARLGELVERQVAIVVRDRTCNITGRQVSEYAVTENLPVKPPPKAKASVLGKKALAALRKLYAAGSDLDKKAIYHVVQLAKTQDAHDQEKA